MAGHESYVHLFSTNAAPMPAEIASVKQSINNLKEKIAKLKSQLQELEGDLQQHQSLLSPLRRVPVEILGDILLYALPPILSREDRFQLVDLSLVCRKWRNSALCTYLLWNRIQVSRNRQLSFGKVVQWLERSGSAPKTLNFHLCGFDLGGCGLWGVCGSENMVSARLLEEGPLLDCLSLRLSEAQCFQRLLDSMRKIRSNNSLSRSSKRPWDSIRSFTLEFDAQHVFQESIARLVFPHLPSSVKSFQFRLPSRREIDGEGLVDPDPLAVSPLLPPNLIQHLTSLSFSCDWDERHFYQILDHCQGIEYLTLDLSSDTLFSNPYDPTFLEQSQSKIRLQKLNSLTLQKTTRWGTNILRLLHVPNLVHLDMQYQTSESYDEVQPQVPGFSPNILHLVGQSQCQNSFRSLRISGPYLRNEEMTKLLGGLPSLSHLCLDNVRFEDDWQLFMALADDEPRCLPHLEILELRQLSPTFDIDSVNQFICCRRKAADLNSDEHAFYEPDSLRKVVVTYEKSWPLKNGYDYDDPMINALRRSCGVVINVGPKEYFED